MLLVLVLAALATFGPGTDTARADDAAESRFFDQIARDAYGHHRYPEALEAFLRAHRAAPSARSLYNIALCAQLAHRDAMAFAYFDELLRTPESPEVADLRADATTRITALRRRLALVSVTSDPPGATIYVDQRDHGSFGTTPRTLALPAGAHHLTLELADHEAAATDVTAAVGESHSAEATLPAHRGTVAITTPSPDVTLTARRDGADAEVTIPAGERATLEVGHYTIVAHADGYRDASVEVQVARDSDERRAITLQPLPVPTGRLLVTTGEVHARVRVDGSDRAETPARVTDLTVGEHEVAVSADGFLPWTGTVHVDEGRTAFVSVTLVRAR